MWLVDTWHTSQAQEYPGNYQAHFKAIKAHYPHIHLIANCDLTNLGNQVSFPHKVRLQHQPTSPCGSTESPP